MNVVYVMICLGLWDLLDTVHVNVRLCFARSVDGGTYLTSPVSVTLTLFQSHSGVKQLKLKVVFLCKFSSGRVQVLVVYLSRWHVFKDDN